MKIKSVFSCLFKLGLAIFGALGIIVQVIDSPDPLGALSYFTSLSNIYCVILCAVFGIMIIAGKDPTSSTCLMFKGSSTIMIMITHIVFHYIIFPNEKLNFNTFSYHNIMAHYVVPLGMLADYILFDEKGRFKYKYIIMWTLIPTLFIPFAYTKTYISGVFDRSTGKKYPYFFMNYEKYGVKKVTLIICGILAFCAFLSSVLVFVDHLLGRAKKEKKE